MWTLEWRVLVKDPFCTTNSTFTGQTDNINMDGAYFVLVRVTAFGVVWQDTPFTAHLARNGWIFSKSYIPWTLVACRVFVTTWSNAALHLRVSRNGLLLCFQFAFTKWKEAFAIPNQEAKTVAEKLVKEVISRYGAPEKIHSDQGRNFEAQLFQEMCLLFKIDKTRPWGTTSSWCYVWSTTKPQARSVRLCEEPAWHPWRSPWACQRAPSSCPETSEGPLRSANCWRANRGWRSSIPSWPS